MSVLGRKNWLPAARIDLPDLLANDSYNRFDFRSVMFSMCGNTPYILRGFEATGWSGTSLTLKVSNALVWCPNNAASPFWQGLSTDADLQVSLQPSSTVYLELDFEEQTRQQVTAGFWDPNSIPPDNPAGIQYTESVDAQIVMVPVLRQRFGGFTAGAIRVLVAVVDANGVVSIQDARDPMFGLRKGGANPDPYYNYPFADARVEPPQVSTSSANLANNNPQSVYYSVDANGRFLNDKSISSMKDWMDAIMTVLKEIKGTPTWYQGASATAGFPSNLNLYSLLMDSQGGHSILASEQAQLAWSVDAGTGTGDSIFRSYNTSATQGIRWQLNYGSVSWMLGGTFVGLSTDRAYTNTSFTSATIPDGSSLYLKIQREAILNSDPNVTWSPGTAPHPVAPYNLPAQTVTGSVGNFTGIAVGDYIRKESEGILNYYKVIAVWNGGTSSWDDTAGIVAGPTCDTVVVSTAIPSNTVEGYRFFRERYSNADLVVNTGSTISDVDYYWIGRRTGNIFYLRDFGNMNQGEVVQVLNDADVTIEENSLESTPIITIDPQTSVLAGEIVRILSTGPSRDTTPMLTIMRSQTQDTIAPVGGNRRTISYTLANNLGLPTNALTLANDGDELWVRLSDTQSATAYTLSSGTIASGTDNVYQVLSSTASPLRTFYNRNVYMLAKRVDIAGVITIVFADGQKIADSDTIVRKPIRIKSKDISANYLATYQDTMLSVNTAIAVNITLPVISEENDGQLLVIKDRTSQSYINNITITAGVGNTIDNSATAVINYEYGSLTLKANMLDSRWEII